MGNLTIGDVRKKVVFHRADQRVRVENDRRAFIHKRSQTNNPVILIPGIFGSRLYGKLGPGPWVPSHCPDRTKLHLVWVRFKDLIPKDCFLHWFKLDYNITTHQMEDNTGAYIATSFFGHPKTVQTLDETHFDVLGYYNKIIQFLKERGYSSMKDLFGAPYDFRKLPTKNYRNYYFRMLKNTIEESFEKNNKKVVLISHSMGSALTHWFLSERDQDWKDKYIAGWISLNGAFAGSIKAFISRTYGHSDLLPAKLLLGFKSIAELLSTFPSFYYLMPSKSYFGPDRVLAEMNDKPYTIGNVSEIEKKVIGRNDELIRKMNIRDIWIDKPVNVPFFCIYSTKRATITKITINEDYTLDEEGMEYGDGDGTLTKDELKSCKEIAKKITNYPTRVEEVLHVNHMKILKSEETLDLLDSYLSSL